MWHPNFSGLTNNFGDIFGFFNRGGYQFFKLGRINFNPHNEVTCTYKRYLHGLGKRV